MILRNLETGREIDGVPMLIDSGADVSLLPRSAIASNGIVGAGERHELEAFGGAINDSEAVLAAIIFLNKTFRGLFLQVDSEVGIIGRNILNRVRLRLDGPALSWEEIPLADAAS